MLCTIITKLLLLDWTGLLLLDYWTGPQSHKPYYFTCFLTHHLSRDRACAGGKNCNTNTRYKHFRSLEDGILGLCIVSEGKFSLISFSSFSLPCYCLKSHHSVTLIPRDSINLKSHHSVRLFINVLGLVSELQHWYRDFFYGSWRMAYTSGCA